MDAVVTLAERHRRKLDAMLAALSLLDAELTAYAREHAGCLVRFGSSATGRTQVSSDIDILADSPARTVVAACDAADGFCTVLGLVPDCGPSAWCSDAVRTRAFGQGVVLT